jgi:hypothetical protein
MPRNTCGASVVDSLSKIDAGDDVTSCKCSFSQLDARGGGGGLGRGAAGRVRRAAARAKVPAVNV